MKELIITTSIILYLIKVDNTLLFYSEQGNSMRNKHGLVNRQLCFWIPFKYEMKKICIQLEVRKTDVEVMSFNKKSQRHESWIVKQIWLTWQTLGAD